MKLRKWCFPCLSTEYQRNDKSKKNEQRQKTNSSVQNTSWKTKDYATRAPSKPGLISVVSRGNISFSICDARRVTPVNTHKIVY